MEESQRLSKRSTPLPVPPRAGNADVSNDALAIRQRALQAVFDAQPAHLKGVLRSYVVKMGVAKGNEAQELTLDLYSELYEAAMKTAEKFDPTRSGLPWLLRIGYHLVLRKRESQMRLRQHEASLADLASPNFGLGSEEARADADVFDRLAALGHQHAASTALEARHGARELLDLVAPSDRTVLQLAILHGLGGDALAQHLGINPPAARQRLHRAINRLREAYDNHLNPPEPHRG